jgi:hypothetical protein
MVEQQIQRAMNPGLCVLFGMRSSLDVGELVHPTNIIEIARLNESQALAFCEKLGGNALQFLKIVLANSDDPSAKRLLLTPLILNKLMQHAGFDADNRISSDELRTTAGVFEAALRIHLQQSQLDSVEPEAGKTYTIDNWLDALTIVGHTSFSRHWGTWSQTKMLEALCEHVQTWKNLAQSVSASPELQKVLRGFELACNPVALSTLHTRSLFRAAITIRFEHREWEEFLAARHLAYSVNFGNVIEMSRRGSWTRMHFLVRDILSREPDAEFTGDLVQKVVEKAQNDGLGFPEKYAAQIPIGNLLGVVGHSERQMRRQVFSRLTSAFIGRPTNEIPPLVELVAVQTLGFRMLSRYEFDSGLSDVFIKSLRATYGPNRAIAGSPNALLKLSAGWWDRALTGENAPASSVSIQDPNVMTDALVFVSTHAADGQLVTNILDETMHRVLLNMQLEMLSYRMKTIACVTYLTALVAADRHGILVPDVRSGIRRMLGRGEIATRLARSVQEYVEVPDLGKVWKELRIEYLKKPYE